MMRRLVICIFALLLVAAATSGLIAGETELRGEIGVDLEGYGFTREAGLALVNTGAISQLQMVPRHEITRNRSSHYLNLALSGTIGTEQFANYSATSRLLGVYFSSRSDGQEASEYVGPELSSYYMQATVLAGKPYPIQFYRTESTDHALRFEANNRSIQGFLRPALSVIRRYENEREATGVRWRLTPKPEWKSTVEYKQELNRNDRIYAFGENLDIWVQYVPSVARPGDSVFTVVFENGLTDTVDVVIVNLDSLFNNGNPLTVTLDDIPPAQTRTTELFIGENEIQIGSRGFNQLVDVVDLESNLLVDITFRDPSAPNDIDQTRTTATVISSYESADGRLKNDTQYEYSDLEESVQELTNYLNSFTNTGSYQISNTTDVRALTTITQDRTGISDVSSQSSRSIAHETRLGYLKRRGISAGLMHGYSHTLSKTGGFEVRSTLQNIRGRVTYPTHWMNHYVTVREDISLQSDNTGYGNDQYTTIIGNTLAARFFGFNVEPKHELKYTIGQQKNPGQQLNELESKTGLIGDRYLGVLGDVRLRGEHNYRRKSSDAGTDTKHRYVLDLSTLKRFGRAARLGVTVMQEWEVFGGSAPTPGEGTKTARETEQKSSYRFDFQLIPSSDFVISGNYMIIAQGETSIGKYGVTLIANLPYVDLPLKSFLTYESRELAGLKPQTTLNVETKVSYNFRQISFILTHVYRDEDLQFDDFSSHEILARISRHFGIL